MKKIKVLMLCLLVLIVYGCARAPLKDRNDAMRKTKSIPELADDLDFESLKAGLQKNIDFIKTSNRINSEIVFGPTRIKKDKYISAIQYLLDQSKDQQTFNRLVKEKFDFYEVYGSEEWGQIKATSYYSPLIKGNIKKSKKYSQPLYSTPQDMVLLDVDAYVADFPKWKIFKEQVLEQRNSKSVVRGRLITEKDSLARMVPYYKREDIDEKNVIKDKDSVIVWVDPIDSFFLQIQGSGVIELPDGHRFTVGYENQNGHSYVAIGSYLLDKIPREKMSMQAIEEHLRSLSKKEAQKIMNLNPSYVFFQKIDSLPLTFLGAEVVDGRTVATDSSLFPKGTLAFLQFEKPVFENSNSVEPKVWVPASRFVIDQDTGGAIRGPARLDLYAGSGEHAAQFAGVMKNPARLYYLVPKDEFLKSL